MNHQGPRVETSTMGRSPADCQPRTHLGAVVSRFMRSTQRMMCTRYAFQPGSIPTPGVRPMAAASLAVRASAMRCWMSGRAANLAAW